jgi:hypothetical protein
MSEVTSEIANPLMYLGKSEACLGAVPATFDFARHIPLGATQFLGTLSIEFWHFYGRAVRQGDIRV